MTDVFAIRITRLSLPASDLSRTTDKAYGRGLVSHVVYHVVSEMTLCDTAVLRAPSTGKYSAVGARCLQAPTMSQLETVRS